MLVIFAVFSLAGPLGGVALGAFITHRLLSGKPPLPPLPHRAAVLSQPTEEKPEATRRLPSVRA